jgi:hypothetical protein
VESSPADAELFGGGGHVAVCRSKRLGNQPSFRLVQVERAGFFTECLSGRNAAGQFRCCCLPHGCGKIAQCNLFAGCHDDAVFDRGAQLADIARPIVSKQRVHRVRREFEQRLVVLLAEVAQESADENWDIFFPLAQRGHYNPHHVEAKIKVVAEFSLVHELLEIFVRGCDQTHIGAQRLIAADSLECSFLTHDAQQFDLRARVDLRDFV